MNTLVQPRQAPVAQLDRASDYESEGLRFESSRARIGRNMRDIEIAKILYLAKNKKYEVTCAAFDLVDHMPKVEIPRILKGRKLAVQAMSLIADEQVNYGYENEEMAPVSESEDEEE